MAMPGTVLALLASASVVFLAAAAPASDDRDWRTYSEEANGDIYFFDAARVTKTAGIRTVWTRIRYKTSVMGAATYQSLVDVDCTARTEKIVQRTFFSDRDWKRPAMNTDTSEKPARPIGAGSAAARLFAILCEK